jgi:hypothetical protein
MRIFTAWLIGVLFIFPAFGSGEKTVVLTEVNKPTNIETDDQHLYVTERSQVFIYSLKDFKLKKKFGKAGEGPREFQGAVELVLQPDYLFINSTGKISYYSKNGAFQKEIKVKGGVATAGFRPFKDRFAGFSIVVDQGVVYRALSLFDAQTDKIKELARVRFPMQRTGDLPILETAFDYRVYDNKLFTAVKKDFEIDVSDYDGKLLFKIRLDNYEPRPFTPEDERGVRAFFRFQLSTGYERVKNRFAFPRNYPAVWFLLPVDDRLYAAAWKQKDGNTEVYIFDMQGNLLKSVWLPILLQGPLEPFPITISGGKLYQLVENEEKEEWELRVSTIGH